MRKEDLAILDDEGAALLHGEALVVGNQRPRLVRRQERLDAVFIIWVVGVKLGWWWWWLMMMTEVVVGFECLSSFVALLSGNVTAGAP